jgi:hypothetical protein
MYQGSEVTLRDLRTEGQTSEYKKSTIVIPYGAGIKYNVGGKWTLGAELGYRYTRTDFLDDVSGYYAPASALPTPLSVVLADQLRRANRHLPWRSRFTTRRSAYKGHLHVLRFYHLLHFRNCKSATTRNNSPFVLLTLLQYHS